MRSKYLSVCIVAQSFVLKTFHVCLQGAFLRWCADSDIGIASVVRPEKNVTVWFSVRYQHLLGLISLLFHLFMYKRVEQFPPCGNNVEVCYFPFMSD